jgi:hypothetical protein
LCSYSLPFKEGDRRTAFLFGTMVTLVWLGLLSFAVELFWISPVVPWTMTVATVASSIYFWHRLLHAGTQDQPINSKVVAASVGALKPKLPHSAIFQPTDSLSTKA